MHDIMENEAQQGYCVCIEPYTRTVISENTISLSSLLKTTANTKK